jgi:hypothetical protein
MTIQAGLSSSRAHIHWLEIWLSAALHSRASARPGSGLDRTVGHVSTAVRRRADLPMAVLYRLVVTLTVIRGEEAARGLVVSMCSTIAGASRFRRGIQPS